MSFQVRELTACAPGAVAVLELAGPGCLVGVRALTARGGAAHGRELRPGDLRLVRLFAGEELLDEALCWVESDARVELHLHGSLPVVERVTAELLAHGGRAPEPSRSLEERAAERLADAASEAAARILLDQVQGALRRELEALLDSGGDPEGDVRRLRALHARGRVMRHLVSPPRVVLAGPVNAGKSTLFNLLVGHERVVVHDEQGTTRDAVRERVRVGAYAVDLVDTAGERDLGACGQATGQESESGRWRVERAGQLLGRELRRSADLVLWLDPAGRAPATARGSSTATTRVLVSRADEGDDAPAPGARRLSALARPEEARRIVCGLVHEALELPEQPWEAGAPVPFEEAQLRILEEHLGGRGPGRREALESLLAR